MTETKQTRRAKESAEAAKEAAPKIADKTAPAEGSGDAPASDAEKAGVLVDPIQGLVRILAENIRHNTALLELIGKRSAEQACDRAASVEQLRTILDYKSIGQMVGRNGTPFQDNLINAARGRSDDSPREVLALFDLPDGAATASVQVDGDKNAEVFDVGPGDAFLTLKATRGRDIGRIEVLNSELEPIRVGPRMAAVPLTNNPRFQ